jgi:uncharacterized protein YjbI with pentapeptide repeats
MKQKQQEQPFRQPPQGRGGWGWTDLRRADLSRAVLFDADLSDARLSGADLSGIRGVTPEELETAAFSLSGATMPDGSIHP